MAGESLTLRRPQFLNISIQLLDGRGVLDTAPSAVLELLNGRVPISLCPPHFRNTPLELMYGKGIAETKQTNKTLL